MKKNFFALLSSRRKYVFLIRKTFLLLQTKKKNAQISKQHPEFSPLFSLLLFSLVVDIYISTVGSNIFIPSRVATDFFFILELHTKIGLRNLSINENK